MSTSTQLPPVLNSQRPQSCSTCSLYNSARGFCLDVGDFASAQIVIALETPAQEEVNFSVMPPPAKRGERERSVLGTVKEAQAELLRRSAAFPDVPAILRARGVPVVGRTGAKLNKLLAQVGLDRSKIPILNSVRCWPPKSAKGDNYPTGAEKSVAQSMCRQYDRLGDGPGKFNPDLVLITMHPASVFKEGASSGEPLILADLEKAACFAKEGHKVLVVMGGHAAEVFLGFGSNVSRWRGHYEWTHAGEDGYNWYTKRLEKLQAKADKARRVKVPKVKKLTKAELAREELAWKIVGALEEHYAKRFQGVQDVTIERNPPDVREEQMKVVLALLTPPPRAKKVKVVEPEQVEKTEESNAQLS